jgi:hypothetical protein
MEVTAVGNGLGLEGGGSLEVIHGFRLLSKDKICGFAGIIKDFLDLPRQGGL